MRGMIELLGRFRPATRFALLLLAGMALLATPASARVEFLNLRCPSLAGAKKDCRVYFPPSYDAPESRTRRYPMIVFLHGWPGSEGNWPGQGHVLETLDAMSASGRIPEVIALFPDGGGVGLLGRSIWLDAAGGRSNMEEFLVRDLVAWADSSFRTIGDARHRGAIGLSDGATGSLNLAFRHPDVFGACGGLSGDYRLKKDMSSGHIFGDEPEASRLRAKYSPLEYVASVAPKLANTSIYIDCGSGDESIADNRELDALLTKLGVAHTFHEFPGSHDWGYWREHVKTALEAVTVRMR